MHIAKTVRSINTLDNSLARAIMDRHFPITKEFVDQVISLTQFTWHGRRPRPAFDSNGNPRASDLDLMSVLVELAIRNAKIRLPGYKNRLPWKITAGEQHVGTDRFGKVLKLISHREHLSFSVRILDESVIVTDKLRAGAPRTYMLVDHNGEWHSGWRGLTWKLDSEETGFFEKRRLIADGSLHFKYYVHPNRRQSIYGAPYLLLKLLLQRIEDELTHYKREVARLGRLGITLPEDEVSGCPVIGTGPSKNVFVKRLRVKLSGLEYSESYPEMTESVFGLKRALEHIKKLENELQPIVQFIVRADEVAFYMHGRGSWSTPHWIKGPEWTFSARMDYARIQLGKNLVLSLAMDEVPKAVAA